MSMDEKQKVADAQSGLSAVDVGGNPENANGQAEPEGAEPLVDVEEIHRLLADAQSKADQHWEQLMRVRADLENQRRRHERELEKAHKFALEGFVNDLLQVWDSLELGVQAAQEPNVAIDRLREGNTLTLKLLTDVMTKAGVTQINPQGEVFNPNLHQAISMLPGGEVEANRVLQVVQKGYALNERLVRPAMVVVSAGRANS